MTRSSDDFERLVQLIERSISPGSVVEHNVFLPILNSRQGATTQCDVVIRTGSPPRQTVTLVEVQRRGSRVKPNDFRGWRQKLVDVGAQHLICVSQREFPKSIREQAANSGGTVMLVTLKEAAPDRIPVDFVRINYTFSNFDVTNIVSLQPSYSRSEAERLGIRDQLRTIDAVNVNDMYWSLDGRNCTSLYILCRDFYARRTDERNGTGQIKFLTDGGAQPLYFCVGTAFLRIGLECTFEWTYEHIERPVSILSYEQDQHGALAWVAEVEHESSKGRLSLRLPLVRAGDCYVINALAFELPHGVELQLFTHREESGAGSQETQSK